MRLLSDFYTLWFVNAAVILCIPYTFWSFLEFLPFNGQNNSHVDRTRQRNTLQLIQEVNESQLVEIWGANKSSNGFQAAAEDEEIIYHTKAYQKPVESRSQSVGTEKKDGHSVAQKTHHSDAQFGHTF